MAPLSLDFERTNSNSQQEMRCEVSVGKMELLESLYERSAGVSADTPYSVTQVMIPLWKWFAVFHLFVCLFIIYLLVNLFVCFFVTIKNKTRPTGVLTGP